MARRRACSLSMVSGPWAGASLRHAMIYRGLKKLDSSNALTMCRFGQSRASIYGVVIEPEDFKVDAERTQQKRREILAQRLTDGRTLAPVKQKDPTGAVVLLPAGEYLEVIRLENERITRCRCGYQFGPVHQNWKDHASVISPIPEALGPGIKLHKDLEIRQYFCPQCGLSLEVETLRRGDSPLFDIELKI